MAEGSAHFLSIIEPLMNEFFDSGTSNERKREIESVLQQFSSQQGAWKHCLYFLENSNNQYVCMYSLTTIETLITKQWLGLMWEERVQLKASLYQHTLDHHRTVPTFIRNKLVKLVVDIARFDWPHFYPDFFTNVLQLVQTPDTTVLGLVFLLTASEELVCPWEDLSVSRKEELRRLLLTHLPQVLNLLTGLLTGVLQKQKRGVTATPPPSPTHGQPSTSPVHTGSLLSCILDGGQRPPDYETICCLVLQVLAHLFSWVPVTSSISPRLISIVFQLAATSQGVQGREDGQNMGTLAMAVINELLYKNCVPVSCEEFFLVMFQQALHLLQSWLSAPHSISDDSTYLEKLIEFLRLFVGLHLRRLEANPRFPVLDFLELLFKFTFQGSSMEHFYSCLEVWNLFLEHLHSKRASAARYQGAVVSLVSELLRKMQFKHNQVELEQLDDQQMDDDEQTEWQHFLCQCIETVAKVAELVPMETYNLVHDPWQEAGTVYLRLDRALEGSSGVRRLGIASEHECTRLHCLLRDLATLTQAVGRMCPHFVGESFVSGFAHGQQLVQRMAGMANYATQHQLHHVQVSTPVLTLDLVEVHAQVLAALKAWCHWVAQLHCQPNLKSLHDSLVSDIVKSASQVIVGQKEPAKLCHSSAHLLLTLTSTVRPPQLWEQEPFKDLFRELAYLQPETRRVVQRALCNSLLLVWPGATDQLWDQRHKLLSSLVGGFTEDYRHLGQGTNLSLQVAPVVTSTLQLLGDLVLGVLEEGSTTRKLLYSVIQESVYQSLAMFLVYVKVAEICEAILDFFLTTFGGLQQQLGAAFTERTVQTFLEVFTREQVGSSLDQDGGSGVRVVEKLLQLLQLVMAEPGAAFRRFVPSTIELCLDHVYPLVCESASPDVKGTLFALLHAVLLHKWQFFYRGSVLRTFDSGNGHQETPEHRERLVAILRAYGQSLLQPDINLFGQNLRSLETLNTKWKLYHKEVFREELLAQFLTVLLHTLLHKSHALLAEDIAVAVYNMAAISFPAFHDQFLPHFLRTTDGLDDTQRSIVQRNFKQETDLPSFTQNVQRLVNDMRCYRLCNLSLPPGSVKLN